MIRYDQVEHMKKYTTAPLSDEDVRPFVNRDDVSVWVYKKKQWFVGLLSSMTVEPECKLRVEPVVKFIPHNTNPSDMEIGTKLIEADETIVEFLEKALPFTLNNPERLIFDEEHADMLTIQFADGMAILSRRAIDASAINEFILLAQEKKI